MYRDKYFGQFIKCQQCCQGSGHLYFWKGSIPQIVAENSFLGIASFFFNIFQVCELDIIFNFEKAYFILDEFLLGGEVQETSKKNVLKAIEQADLLQEVHNFCFFVKAHQHAGLIHIFFHFFKVAEKLLITSTT